MDGHFFLRLAIILFIFFLCFWFRQENNPSAKQVESASKEKK